MSGMTPCNHCTLLAIQKVAEKGGGTVVIRPAPMADLEGADAAVDVLIRYPSQEEPVWAAWLMRVTRHCVC